MSDQDNDNDNGSEQSSISSNNSVADFSSIASDNDVESDTADTHEELIENIMDGHVQNHLRISPILLIDILYRNQGENCEAVFQAIAESERRIESLELYLPCVGHWEQYSNGSYEVWERFGKRLGGLVSLKTILVKEYVVFDEEDDVDVDEEGSPLDFTCLSYCLRWTGIETLRLQVEISNRHRQSLSPLLETLRNISTLQSIEFSGFTEPEALDPIISALQALPLLQTVVFSSIIEGDRRRLPDSLFELTATDNNNSIRELILNTCTLTKRQCQLLSQTLASSSTTLENLNLVNARFEDSGNHLIAKALRKNTSLQHLQLTVGGLSRQFFEILAQAIPGAKTTRIQSLKIENFDSNDFDFASLAILFQSFQRGGTLQEIKHLVLSFACWWGHAATMTLRNYLADPAWCRLETLSIHGMYNMPEWRAFLSFLQTNRSLKYLGFFRAMDRYSVVEVASFLEHNSTLEVLIIRPTPYDEETISGDNNDTTSSDPSYISARAVEALKQNCTLRHLQIVHPTLWHKDQSDTGSKVLVQALRKNFGIGIDPSQSWKDFVDCSELRRSMLTILKDGRSQKYRDEIEAICLLNKAGRRYLLEDPSNKVRGVNVLCAVRNNINCLFLHLLENPSLCEAPFECRPSKRKQEEIHE